MIIRVMTLERSRNHPKITIRDRQIYNSNLPDEDWMCGPYAFSGELIRRAFRMETRGVYGIPNDWRCVTEDNIEEVIQEE